MDAIVKATCPNCQAILKIPVQWVGQPVKCKKCGTIVRSRPKSTTNDTAESAPLDPTTQQAVNAPAGNAFDFSKPTPEDDNFPLPEPIAPPEADAGDWFDPTTGANAPPQPPPPGHIPGYSYPLPPGMYPPPGAYPGAYAPPPGYPYPLPPGYPYPLPPGAYPPGAYGPPPGYPYPPSGHPAGGYPPPGAGYAPPPGYNYGHGYGLPPGAMPPAPAAPPFNPEPTYPPNPPAGGTGRANEVAPDGKPARAKPALPAKPQGATPTARPVQPSPAIPVTAHATPATVAPSSDFQSGTPVVSGTSRYRRKTGKSKAVWLFVTLLLTAGMVTGAIYGAKYLDSNFSKGKKETPGENAKAGPEVPNPATPADATGGVFPRRMLFIHISRYMFLNPLTHAERKGGSDGEDRSKPAAIRLAYEWNIPYDPRDAEKNQLYVLSDTARPDNARSPEIRTPMKPVVQGAYEEFFATSRPQDRIVFYFGGHAIEAEVDVEGKKEKQAFIAPIEGDPDDPQATLIPVSAVYEKLKACKATQRVVIWDVCRFNPQRGRQRPGSEPMTESLYQALAAAPPGVEVIITCQPGENALEFFNLVLDSAASGARATAFAGSSFLESMRYVASKNVRQQGKQPTPADPIMVGNWAGAVGARVNEMATTPVVNLKQTLKTEGKPPANWIAYNPAEPLAKRFEFPSPPKGAPADVVGSIVSELTVPPIKLDLVDTGLNSLVYREESLKDYMADVSLTDIMKDKETYKFQATTLRTLDRIRQMWTLTPGAGGPQMRDDFKAPVDDNLKKSIKEEQDFWAVGIAELDVLNLELDALAADRDNQTKRWQAHYDYANAVLKARLAFMNEYNKLLGDVLTETLPNLDLKRGQDSYKLTSTDRMKSKRDIQMIADEAKAAYDKVITEHKGTPWAIQAKRERAFSLGLAWLPISSGNTTEDAK